MIVLPKIWSGVSKKETCLVFVLKWISAQLHFRFSPIIPQINNTKKLQKPACVIFDNFRSQMIRLSTEILFVLNNFINTQHELVLYSWIRFITHYHLRTATNLIALYQSLDILLGRSMAVLHLLLSTMWYS